MPEPKDVVLAVLGASGALAGLLLIFSGFIFSQAASFPTTVPDAVTSRYQKAARAGVYPFLGFLLTTILCTVWLLHPNSYTYWASVLLFIGLVVGTGIYGAVAVYRYL
jgi:hypothetical protein